MAKTYTIYTRWAPGHGMHRGTKRFKKLTRAKQYGKATAKEGFHAVRIVEEGNAKARHTREWDCTPQGCTLFRQKR